MTNNSGSARVALLGIAHESNTFAARGIGERELAEAGVLRGEQLRRVHAGGSSMVAGFVDTAERLGMELVPILHTFPTPAGPIARPAFDALLDEALAGLRDGGPWDAVLLAQHGAAVAEGCLDTDGLVLQRVREAIGPAAVVGLCVDMHANLSPAVVAASTVLVGYRTNPHLDAYERAVECAELVMRTLSGAIRPVQALEKPPLAVEILRQGTSTSPMRELIDDLEAVLAWPGVLSATIAQGFPYADVPNMGMGFVVVADGDTALARRGARWLAGRAWVARDRFRARATPVGEALRAVAQAPPGPVLLLDVGDNVGAGGGGDSVALLAEGARLGVRPLLAILVDPEAARRCTEAGVGARLSLSVGGPGAIVVSGTVTALGDGRFEQDAGDTHAGLTRFEAGPTAVLRTTDDHTLVLASHRIMPISVQQVRALGLDPACFRAIVAKGVASPLPAYGPFCKTVIAVDSPGTTPADVTALHYRHRPRPLHPFEGDASYAAE
ncbi:MAG TPA: M81 family metallopeptidase [Conexibacter sp.]|jgi:microcystin degradation protein MlrC|nr:M81 family metallopeptidase [Conexibacter sp.]